MVPSGSGECCMSASSEIEQHNVFPLVVMVITFDSLLNPKFVLPLPNLAMKSVVTAIVVVFVCCKAEVSNCCVIEFKG